MLDRVLESIQPFVSDGIARQTSIGGGDFAQAYRLELYSGQCYFLKTHANPPDFFFTTEAEGLRWLRATTAVNVPEVIAVSDEPPYLLMEWVDLEPSTFADEAEFGAQLAALHQHTHPEFGRPDKKTTGSLALPNVPCGSWEEFYAEHRLLPLAKIAHEKSSLSRSVIRKIELVAEDLINLSVPVEPPSLLHGDLWAGNRVVDDNGKSWLIDPAAHYGHREFDLAMMRLFGGYSDNCFESYSEHYPLAKGWQNRVSLHQLAPLIVHSIKFGGHYVSATESALNQYL
ncbi:MAG: fructosamine kinase family protein [Acidiferrobacterales bacterium]|nr:fructosamine kinase family protein [Acidiferrobacterales bacterium]